VSKIVMHPDYKPHHHKFDADLAMIFLEREVEFTRNIKPVCLPSADLENYSGYGTVVGWGRTEDSVNFGDHSDIPKQKSIQAVNDSFCYTEDDEIAKISSLRTFCAGGGGRDRAGICSDGIVIIT